MGKETAMKILNFGSLNIDYVYRVDYIVQPGETIASKDLKVFPGGKGLNQSVAFAKAGAEVYHAGLIGEDGRFLKEYCKEQGIHTEFIEECKERTGNAIIQVSDKGENCIILFPGANRKITRDYIERVFEFFGAGDMLVLQNEINMISHLIEKGKEKGMTVALNVSPYDATLAACDLSNVDVFLMNEVEGEQITGEKEYKRIVENIKQKYPEAKLVLTLGEQGAVYSDSEEEYYQEACQVSVVDTTAAGDTFTGYFLVDLLEEKGKQKALKTATYASALAVSKQGASVAIPRREEVDSYLQK